MLEIDPEDVDLHVPFGTYGPQKDVGVGMIFRLFLTDSRGRPLGRTPGSNSKTAAGGGTAQSTTGNLSFSCTLRLDVIQKMQPNTLQTPKPQQPIPARFTGPLLNQDFGKPKI